MWYDPAYPNAGLMSRGLVGWDSTRDPNSAAHAESMLDLRAEVSANEVSEPLKPRDAEFGNDGNKRQGGEGQPTSPTDSRVRAGIPAWGWDASQEARVGCGNSR
jgi:hypothetical protein